MANIKNNCPHHPGAELRNIDNDSVRCNPQGRKCKWTRSNKK